MVLSFPYAFVPRTLSVGLLNPKAAPGTQTTHILPDSGGGGWSEESLGSDRISRDTRRNNPIYGSMQFHQPPPPPRSPTPLPPSSPAPLPSHSPTPLPPRRPQSSSQSPDRNTMPIGPQTPIHTTESEPATFIPTISEPQQQTSQTNQPSVASPGNTPQESSPLQDDHQSGPSHIQPGSPHAESGPSDAQHRNQNQSHQSEDPELKEMLNTIDSTGVFPIPGSSQYVREEGFEFSELQQLGLLNLDMSSCYMNSVILLLHRIRMKDGMLDNDYCSSQITRNFKRSMITKLVREVLEAMPSDKAFSLRNLIAGWHYIDLQPKVTLGIHEDAQEVLATLLNNMLLKASRSDSQQLLTKFQGQLTCRSTRDCIDQEIQDFYVGQTDICPFFHVIGLDNSSDNPVNIREKLSEFMNNTFESRCKAIMCRKRIREAKIKVKPGRFTLLALNRNLNNQSKMMQKVDLVPFSSEVDEITQNPIAVISHAGSVGSGHYILYSKIDGDWYVNDDNKKLFRSQFSPFDQNYLCRETADIVVFENKQ